MLRQGADFSSGRRRAVVSLICIAVVGACGSGGGIEVKPPNVTPSPTDSQAVLNALGRLLALEQNAEAAWPGFDLSRSVVMVSAIGDGPVGLVGDSAPPQEFRRSASDPRVWLRDGPPPDSLARVQLGMAWHGTRGVATVLPLRDTPGFVGSLVHESFHTYQAELVRQGRARFSGGFNRSAADTAVEPIAMLLRVTERLGAALRTTDDEDAVRLIREALALRSERCAVVGDRECETERGLEHREGLAAFVEARAIAGNSPAGIETVRDSVAALVETVESMPRFARLYFYDLGHAWLLAADRIAKSDWREMALQVAPDSVVSLLSGGPLAASPDDAALMRARVAAAGLIRAEGVRRDSVVREFWAQPGIPVRVYAATGPRSGSGDSNAVSAHVDSAGRRIFYVINLREARQWFPGDSTHTVTRWGNRIGGCEGVAFCVTVIADPGGEATVDGVQIDLRRAGPQHEGSVRLMLNTIELASPHARLQAHGDSVTVWFR